MKEKLSKSHQVEYDIEMIVEDCSRKYDVPSDFYGDHLPEEIQVIMTKMRVSKSVEEYTNYLDEARNLIEFWAILFAGDEEDS